jgi:WXG100 family type VII secretion target
MYGNSFIINHGGADESAQVFGKAVQDMGTIIGDLNQALGNMDQAVQGQASSLWADQQNSWNADYSAMETSLSSGVKTLLNIHALFREGDNLGGKLFL